MFFSTIATNGPASSSRTQTWLVFLTGLPWARRLPKALSRSFIARHVKLTMLASAQYRNILKNCCDRRARDPSLRPVGQRDYGYDQGYHRDWRCRRGYHRGGRATAAL